MQRYKLTIEYDGRPYVGWQRQDNGLSVQEVLEKAVEAFDGGCPLVQGSGRTDAGVHALGQVAHVDINRQMTADKVMGAINYHLQSAPVSILSAEAVSDDFHARFSAEKRHYTYKILNRRSPATFQAGLMWPVKHQLDVAAMQAGAVFLIGRHDFTTFRNVQCQAKSPVKTLDYIEIDRIGEELHVQIGAKSFLHNQVRSIVGSLTLVGGGRWQPEDVKKALEAKDRAALGLNAPAGGLYLRQVDY